MLKRLFLILLIGLAGSRELPAQRELPRVLVLATGGTIAGEQREPGTLGGYEIRKTVEEIVDLIPEAQRYATIETEQFANLPSTNITPEHWLQLSKRIDVIFRQRQDLAGIVVTHGTTRLEETAFFLHLTVHHDRPVVVVGAQRPPTGISPDGPLNLLAAIRVAATPEARGKGTLVVMDERILSARDTQKIYARSGGFDAGDMGMLGIVGTETVEFFYAPTRRHTVDSEFDVGSLSRLPVVDVHYSYAGSTGVAVDDRTSGVVLASTGLAPIERAHYERLQRMGVAIAVTFPSGDQIVPALREGAGFVGVKRLAPLHARILLMLALTRFQDYRQIQRIFDQY